MLCVAPLLPNVDSCSYSTPRYLKLSPSLVQMELLQDLDRGEEADERWVPDLDRDRFGRHERPTELKTFFGLYIKKLDFMGIGIYKLAHSWEKW